MFGSKKRKYIEAAESIAGILGPMSGGKAIEDKSGNVNIVPLGYIFGFVDAALKVRNLNVDSDAGAIVLKSLLDTFWPTKGESYLKTLVTSSGKDDVIDAAGYGRSDYVNVLNNDEIPFGLSLAILAMENPDEAREFADKIQKLKNKHGFSISMPRSFARHEARVTRKVDRFGEMVRQAGS